MFMRACLFLFAFVLLQGCVAVQTFPIAARAGDTITLAVGSPDGMTRNNTSVQFVSGAYSTELPIRSVIRLRPDNTSNAAAYDGLLASITNSGSHSPWLSIIVLDLPTGLPVGNAVLTVTTSAVYSSSSVDGVPISLEILPGTGTSNAFRYDGGTGDPADTYDGNLLKLEPGPQVVIRPPQDASTFAAAQIKITLQVQNKNTLELIDNPTAVKVVLDDNTNKNLNSQLQMSWTRVGDTYTINLISPNGTAAVNQTRFSVISSYLSAYQFVSSPAPVITSVSFFDVNGNLKTGMPAASNYSATIE